ncbi:MULTISPECIES: dephospho-CoA kinase [Marinomonas]|jgi:dephospho-CoA kinase|uniref:Dephospho-CoA kinase n=1 Tax=Marinomonas polaris DSM 16579 TaxID=1122206 RepID=A0A1M5KX28_9GAMM|nr:MULTISPECIES: dephospho-CoA kinase [Marinomonas]PJE57070.1 dephospho-CoA kinase [Marinomonas sp. BSi20584]SHG57358.1 dephospho-CoA kinase [Marinomonas polaris DSM 16579]
MTTHTPTIIGLAGGIGSGKSTITKYFNEIGIQSVDADDVARIVVEPGSNCLNNIHQRYGDNILLNDGTLNRKSLRDIIFDNPEERIWLEALTHPAIREEISTRLHAITSSYALLVHPLLFETKQDAVCKLVIAIDVPENVQLQRVMSRDNISRESAEKIMAAQLSNSERIERADLVLENSGNIAEMNAKVLKLHKKILESQSC